MRKKKIIGIVLAAVLVAGGLGGFAYANNNLHESMTGQKLVGWGIYTMQPLDDGTYRDDGVLFSFTNPDCVSEITIDRVFMFGLDGNVIYDSAEDGWFENGLPWTEPMKPHETRFIGLPSCLREPGAEIEPIPLTFVTVEIFWSGAKDGLPLIGWQITGLQILDENGNRIGPLQVVAESQTQMVNMEQVLESHKPKKVYNIGVTQILTHPLLDATRQGFIDQMTEEGFIEGVNVEYDFRNAEGDLNEAGRIAEYFVSEKVDLILSITTPSSQACVEAAKGTDIPVAFAAVTEPVAAGIVSKWDAPRDDNVTGVSDFPDIKAQMKLIKEICPYVTTLGVIYNPDEVNSVLQIEQLNDIKAEVGIVDIVEATVAIPEDVYDAAISLVGKCDAIWIPTDNTANLGLEAIIAVAEAEDIPFFGSMQDTVDRGCIATEGINYTWEGEEAGRYVARILRGEFAGNIPVVKCPGEALVLVVNPAAAERMGVIIPQSVLDRADRIVGE